MKSCPRCGTVRHGAESKSKHEFTFEPSKRMKTISVGSQKLEDFIDIITELRAHELGMRVSEFYVRDASLNKPVHFLISAAFFCRSLSIFHTLSHSQTYLAYRLCCYAAFWNGIRGIWCLKFWWCKSLASTFCTSFCGRSHVHYRWHKSNQHLCSIDVCI